MAVSNDTRFQVSMNLLFQVGALIFIMGGGWYAFQAHAERLDELEKDKLPSLETQVRLGADAIIKMKSDIEYIKDSQAELKEEQKTFKQDLRKEQQEQRVILNRILSELQR